jgi:4-carboxymuconolactone decarboxylase
MTINRNSLLAVAGVVLAVSTIAAPALGQTTSERQARGNAVVRSLNGGEPQPTLERMRDEFPFLAEATEAYALGDVWSRPGLDKKSRQLAAVSAFAALGEPAFLKIHARYALNAGATEAELKEVVYLTTVTAGFPKAIAASQALSELFGELKAGNGGAPRP